MDFITDLSESGGYDSILLAVDRLARIRQFSPWRGTVNWKNTARIYVEHVWKLFGLSLVIVSSAVRNAYSNLKNNWPTTWDSIVFFQWPTTKGPMANQKSWMPTWSNICGQTFRISIMIGSSDYHSWRSHLILDLLGLPVFPCSMRHLRFTPAWGSGALNTTHCRTHKEIRSRLPQRWKTF